ncbi:hypothetical protein GCM10018953_70890 [Streptosporangium nondiastaticum]
MLARYFLGRRRRYIGVTTGSTVVVETLWAISAPPRDGFAAPYGLPAQGPSPRLSGRTAPAAGAENPGETMKVSKTDRREPVPLPPGRGRVAARRVRSRYRPVIRSHYGGGPRPGYGML